MELPPDDTDPVMQSSESEPSVVPTSQELEMPLDDPGLEDEEIDFSTKRRKVSKHRHREGPTRKQLMHSILHIALRDPVLWHYPVPLHLQGMPPEDGMEAYSPPRVLPVMAMRGMHGEVSADFCTGWDFNNEQMRQLFVGEVKGRSPQVLFLSPLARC